MAESENYTYKGLSQRRSTIWPRLPVIRVELKMPSDSVEHIHVISRSLLVLRNIRLSMYEIYVVLTSIQVSGTFTTTSSRINPNHFYQRFISICQILSAREPLLLPKGISRFIPIEYKQCDFIDPLGGKR